MGGRWTVGCGPQEGMNPTTSHMYSRGLPRFKSQLIVHYCAHELRCDVVRGEAAPDALCTTMQLIAFSTLVSPCQLNPRHFSASATRNRALSAGGPACRPLQRAQYQGTANTNKMAAKCFPPLLTRHALGSRVDRRLIAAIRCSGCGVLDRCGPRCCRGTARAQRMQSGGEREVSGWRQVTA